MSLWSVTVLSHTYPRKTLVTLALFAVVLTAGAVAAGAVALRAPHAATAGSVPSQAKLAAPADEQAGAPGAAADGPNPNDSGVAAAEPVPQVTPFHWSAGAGAPVVPNGVQIMSSNGGGADVAEGAAHLHFDVAWTCSTPVCDLHACILAPDEKYAVTECPRRVDGPSPLAFDAEKPLAGGWKVVLFDTGASAGVDGTITGLAA
jgi:hypothetical protein